MQQTIPRVFRRMLTKSLGSAMLATLVSAGAAMAQTSTTYNSTSSFIAPAGVTKVVVECWGGGGSGGSRSSNGQAGGGGGGAYSRSVVNVVPLTSYTVTVGAGSTSGTVPGGDSWFGTATTAMAKGGGSVTNNNTTGAAGGTAAASIGNVKFSGGNGANSASSIGGGGGSSAGYAADGAASIGIGIGGIAPTGGGGGGGGGGLFGGAGVAGTAPGGGGGGATKTFLSSAAAGGAGGTGRVIVSYYPNGGACMTGTAGFNNIIDNACGASQFTNIPLDISGQPTTLGAAPGNARLFNVQLIVAHTFNSELQITLTSPAGTTRNLVLNRFGSGDNLGNPSACPGTVFTLQDGGTALTNTNTSNVSGTFAPEQPLSGFTGNPNGGWVLNVCDNGSGDVGRVVYAKLNFCTIPQITATTTNSPVCAPTAVTLGATATGSPAPSYLWAGTGTFSPNNTSANVSVTGAATGNYTITASSSCGSTNAIIPVVVNIPPTITCPGNSSVCLNTPTFTLTGANPVGGTYSGTGVSAGSFNPATAGVGTHTITYSYTDGNGCTNTPCTFQITVNPLPVVSCPSNSAVCIDAPAFTLVGTGESPTGGTFSGAGVTANSFDPAAAGAGTHTITYSFTNGNSCTNTCTFDITVNPLPVLNCGTYGPVCITDADVTLNATPIGGMWTGTGVTGNTFDPSVGTQLLTYTYTDGNSCTNSCSTTITVATTCNDLCSNAVAVGCNSSTPGNTNGTLADAVPTCTTPLNTAGGVWYTVVGTGGNITASLCGAAYDSKVGVFTTPDCSTFTCVAGDNNSCGDDGEVTFLSTLGTTYYILVTGFGTATGAFTLEVVCSGNNLPPCADNGVVVDIHTDNVGNETSWEIVPVGNTVPVCSGSGYSNNADISINCCLIDGCYVLSFYDSFNDGMCCVNGLGGYKLSTADGKRIIDNAADGTFAGVSSLANGFCVPIGATQLTVGTCDKEDWSINDVLVSGIDPAVSAMYPNPNSGYQFWLFDPDGSYSRRLYRAHGASTCLASPTGPTLAAHLRLSCLNSVLPNVPLDLLLNMRVRPRVNGTYGEFGPACRVKVLSTPLTCPTTKLDDNPLHAGTTLSCGVTGKVVGGSGNASKLFPNLVAGANKYQYEFSYPAESYSRTIATPTGNYALVLGNWGTNPLLCGTVTYDVRVRVSFDGGANWCPYGAVCTVEISNNAPNNCTSTVGGGGGNLNSILAADGGMSLYPNPVRSGNVTLELNGLDAEAMTATVDIFDVFGKKVMTSTLGTDGAQELTTVLNLNELATGMYTVNVTSANTSFTERLVIE